MWLEVARNGRNRRSKKRTQLLRPRRAAAFHRAGQRRRQRATETAGEDRGVPVRLGDRQRFYYHGRLPSGSNIPANGVEAQRKSCQERRGKLGRGGEADAAGEALRRGRGNRQVGTSVAARAVAR